MIRGTQIVEALGVDGRINPTSGYEDDTCVHVKPNSLVNIKDGDWVDIVDGNWLYALLKDRPKINLICVSELTRDRCQGLDNKIVVIEPHHCNFDRELRDRRRVRTVGYIGSEVAFQYSLEELKKQINALELNFIYSVDFKSREEVIEFYKRIDIQVVWASKRTSRQSIGPTKAINAASFGIPTIAYPQYCYKEIDGHYIKAHTIDELLVEVEKMKDEDCHKSWGSRVDWTEKYHIDKRAELYRQLEFV